MSKHVPSLQAKVAELMEQNAKLIESNDLHVSRNIELCEEVETLKKELTDIDTLKELYANADIYAKNYAIENNKLKSEYSQLEDNYNILSKHHDDLIYKFNENLVQHKAIEAETHALKAEIERTNRHINLAENQLHKEQQPTIVNHYHNCTINK
jgi:chromosome segregation ATPase